MHAYTLAHTHIVAYWQAVGISTDEWSGRLSCGGQGNSPRPKPRAPSSTCRERVGALIGDPDACLSGRFDRWTALFGSAAHSHKHGQHLSPTCLSVQTTKLFSSTPTPSFSPAVHMKGFVLSRICFVDDATPLRRCHGNRLLWSSLSNPFVFSAYSLKYSSAREILWSGPAMATGGTRNSINLGDVFHSCINLY